MIFSRYSTSLDVTALSDMLPALNAHIPNEFLGAVNDKPDAISPDSIYGTQAPPKPDTNPQSQYNKLTLLPLLLKTLSYAMIEWPVFRSSATVSCEKPSLVIRETADISIALSTPTGLYTPTIRGVSSLSPYAIQGELKRLQNLGRQIPSALGPRELPKQGGTISVSNIGGIGKGEGAFPRLYPGGGIAIVALGRAKWEEVFVDRTGPGRRRLMLPISWSADHRIVEGAELVAFIENWRSWVEDPERLVGVGR
jgi:2-oxoisovalerate dehydrogenase E2 component (dihydrolipoyl transacylase)